MDDKKLVQAIKQILSRGNNVEVKKAKDGTCVVYEIKKNIVAS